VREFSRKKEKFEEVMPQFGGAPTSGSANLRWICHNLFTNAVPMPMSDLLAC
jgi:hypothetical protein